MPREIHAGNGVAIIGCNHIPQSKKEKKKQKTLGFRETYILKVSHVYRNAL